MLDVIVRVIFGVEDPDEVRRLGQPFERLLDLGVSEQLTVRYALRRLGTLRVWPARARANREIDDVVMPLIAARRNDPRLADQRDILALLMCARGEDGKGLSDSEIRDDLITLMLAGHETTATTLGMGVRPVAAPSRCVAAGAGRGRQWGGGFYDSGDRRDAADTPACAAHVKGCRETLSDGRLPRCCRDADRRAHHRHQPQPGHLRAIRVSSRPNDSSASGPRRTPGFRSAVA